MAKGGGKSSASAGTRKKHARKAAGPVQEPPPKEKKPKGKDKGKSKEPRQKIYIPPAKPSPIQPDPLDTMGLARLLPPDLYIVLKSLGKKDVVTKGKALEALQTNWVDKCRAEGNESRLASILVLMLPVWAHHVSTLFLHPSRRIRVSAAGLHASLLQIPTVRDQIFFFLRETASADQTESIIGTWCMVAHDIERPVAAFARKTWHDAVCLPQQEASGKLVLDEKLMSALLSFIQRSLLDPNGVYSYLNPAPPIAAPLLPKKVGGRAVPSIITKREDPDSSIRSKSEEEEENEQDRMARLRVGALGALKWMLDIRANETGNTLDDLTELLSNPALWTSLHHGQTSPFTEAESFGFSQPSVRKSAWSIIHTLLNRWKGVANSLLPLLSAAILRSAWVEPDTTVRSIMWQPLLFFIKEFPNAWDLEAAFRDRIPDEHADSDSDSNDSDEDDDVLERVASPKLPSSGRPQSIGYRDFLQFLELGCSGSPLQGYPTVVIVLSTIPSSIFASSTSDPPLTNFFTSFWAAIDGRALSSVDRAETSAAFLSSLLECMTFLLRRLLRSPGALSTGNEGGAEETARNLATDQYGRVWEELLTGRLKVQANVAAKIMAQTLVSLDQMDKDIFPAAWVPLSTGIRSETHSAGASTDSLGFVVLKFFEQYFQDGTTPMLFTRTLINEIVQSSILQCENILERGDPDRSAISKDVAPLVNILDTFGALLFQSAEFATRTDQAIVKHSPRLLGDCPALLLAYFVHRRDQEKNLALWHILVSSVSEGSEYVQTAFSLFLLAAHKGDLPEYLKPVDGGLDHLAGKWLTGALSRFGDSTRSSWVRQVLETPGYFLSENGFLELLHSLVSAFSLQVEHALCDPAIPLSSFDTSLDLICIAFQSHPELSNAAHLVVPLLPDVFVLAYLFPKFDASDSTWSVNAANTLWTSWLSNASSELRVDVTTRVKGQLRDVLCDSRAQPRHEVILQVISEGYPGLHVKLLDEIFPSPDKLDAMLHALPSDPIDPSLAVFHDLIPPASSFRHSPFPESTFDARGFSSYARVVAALLQVFSEDRHMAKENMWALRHFLALSIYADDLLRIPSARSPVFDNPSNHSLDQIISRTQQMATYLLSASTDDRWHSKIVAAISKGTLSNYSEGLANFIFRSIMTAKNSDNIMEARIVHIILQHILSNSTKDEADQWMVLARQLEKTAPQMSLAVILSIAKFAPEPPRLDRYRNELAANLLGIPAAKANTEGLLVLRRLAATAPDPESDIVFLPQLRAVNVMKTCQQWIASDEDVDEDVESIMTLMFFHLAPILQNVPGAHWDLVFDVVENNLESCSFSDDSTLVTLARTLKLVIAVQDLVSTNKSLRAAWQERQMSILSLIRDLVATKSDDSGTSSSRSTCRELALSVVQDLPPSLLDQNTLSTMCHLLGDPSASVQKMAYQLLHEAARKRTEHLVVETGVDAGAYVSADLPMELVEILQRNFNQGDSAEQDLFGYLLGWMIVFDLFTDASVKVRSSYLNQLRSLNIIATHFIPNIFDFLNLGEGIPKAFKLDIWAVDEFYVSLYEPGTSSGFQLLAAHLYYRALLTVPSLIRSWVLECKDRQLSTTVGTYTSQHFSPVIIRTELANVKSPEAVADLADDNLTIKVNSLNEIVATYAVDEQQIEIALKMPLDWPLHAIEVKDLKRVGVRENIWRAWILGVHKWSQNGHIVDALSLFKRNITGHFEGQVECAICYSIISVVDYTLPEKPCKTCKNRFHSACLYKWFNTSHTSSCPLCRSEITIN